MFRKSLRAPLVTRRQFVAGSAAAGALVALHPFSAFAQAGQAHLRLIETTDLHVHVFPYDYYADKPNDTVGTARTATLIRGVRAEATNSLPARQRRLPAGQPDGRLHRLRARHEGGRRAPDHHGDERARHRVLDARQPRVQLRARFHGQGARRREISDRLRQSRQGDARVLAARRRRSISSPIRSSRRR